MKNHLGKTWILFILIVFTLNANELASYKLATNKTKAFVKEPIVINFYTTQQNHKEHMFFFVKPKKSKDYDIKLLQKKFNDKEKHNSSATFTYVLFPLKYGIITIHFNFVVKTANDQAVAQSYVDDHDGSLGIETISTSIKVAPLRIKILPLPQDVDLVGDFNLHTKIDKREINQYENINLQYTITGKGYKDKKVRLLDNIPNVTLFSDINDEYIKLYKDGYTIKKDYTYSLSAKNDFIIPPLSLKVYSPKQNKLYTLHAQAYNIKVSKIDPSTLLDNTEEPIATHFLTIETIKEFLIYILLFISGFITAKLIEKFDFSKKNKKFEDIQNAQSAQALVLVLLQYYKNKNLNTYIDELELLAYKKEGGTLNDIKVRIIKEIKKL